jgi:methylisocitrate lyase
MPYGRLDPLAARAQLRARLRTGDPVRMVGAFAPIVARLVEDVGFDAVYVSGAVLSTDLGLPDVGLTTLTEVVARASSIAHATHLPTVVDADTGFGEPLNVGRTIDLLERAGLAGCHLEDQVNPKRCGHLDGKALVSTAEMVQKLTAAQAARKDPNFMIIARTDARSVEGLEGAIARARAYEAAGADAIFCEAFGELDDYRAMRQAVTVPLVANMTEFGKTPLYRVEELHAAGAGMVLYPVTTWRWALGAVEAGLRDLAQHGTQAGSVERMQTRERLYELVDYREYAALDESVAGTGVRTGG